MNITKIPTAVIVCLTMAFLGVVAAYVYLDVVGAQGAEFRGFMNVIMNMVGLVISGSAAVYAGRAANQTNGSLDARIQAGVQRALAVQRSEDTAGGQQ